MIGFHVHLKTLPRLRLLLFFMQGPFGYRGEYGEKGIPGYPGARVRANRTM